MARKICLCWFNILFKEFKQPRPIFWDENNHIPFNWNKIHLTRCIGVTFLGRISHYSGVFSNWSGKSRVSGMRKGKSFFQFPLEWIVKKHYSSPFALQWAVKKHSSFQFPHQRIVKKHSSLRLPLQWYIKKTLLILIPTSVDCTITLLISPPTSVEYQHIFTEINSIMDRWTDWWMERPSYRDASGNCNLDLSEFLFIRLSKKVWCIVISM